MTLQPVTFSRMTLTATAAAGSLLTSWWLPGVAAAVAGGLSTSGAPEEGAMGTTAPSEGQSVEPDGRNDHYSGAVGGIRDSLVALVTSTITTPVTTANRSSTERHSLYTALGGIRNISAGAADAGNLKGLAVTTPVTGSVVSDNRGQIALTTALDKFSQTVLTATYPDRTDFEGDVGGGKEAHPLWLISLMCFLAAICLAIVVIWFVKRRGGSYSRLAVFKEKGYDYIYRPNGVLDDEYENTFVGVSVPLLQDITVI